LVAARSGGVSHVACAADGVVVGLYALLEPQRLDAGALAADPITARWSEHLRRHPMPAGQVALFLRRWLSRDEGERPSPVQAALWLDIKLHYLALRPRLRRVYLCIVDPSPYAEVVSLRRKLGRRAALIETVRGHGYRLRDAAARASEPR
jgi:hypothetical protein